MTAEPPLLEVNDLRTQFTTDRGTVRAVDGVSFSIDRGETFGLVGESGAGKSVTGLSIMRLIGSPGKIVEGEVLYKGEDLLSLSHEELRKIRGGEISMIFQDPMTALNPAFTVRTQLVDTILEHKDLTRKQARERTVELLRDVGIPDAAERVDDYPHQFSGGMRQRVLVGMAISCEPDLIIADEPTTALDVTIQAQILELLNDLQEKYGLAIQMITHDMGIVAQTCDTVGVLYAGKLVEQGPTAELFAEPRHPYTVGLMNSIPRLDDPRDRLDVIEGNMPDLIDNPSGCSFRDRCPHAVEACAEVEPPLEAVDGTGDHTSACIRIEEIDFAAESQIDTQQSSRPERTFGEPILEVDNLRKYFTPETQTWFKQLLDPRYVHAVDDVSLTLREGETVGLVGESGCGKTTLGRSIMQLYEPDEGTVLYAGRDMTAMGRRELRESRSELQMIFQDPFSSLNPRMTVKEIIGRPLKIYGLFDTPEERTERVLELLDEVGLAEEHLNRYPHEFSGGQKQRIGIARALAVEPDVIICDEPVSALDVSVQAKIINLLMDLQEQYGLTYLFIAHDLNVVQHISDRIAVMYLGEIVEVGTVADIFEPPYHPYTEVLLSSIPQPDPADHKNRIKPTGEPPSPIDPPTGCRFHTRCPYRMPECEKVDPVSIDVGSGHTLDCHLFDEELMAERDEEEAAVAERQGRVLDP
ncbi:MAG: ABC transporter ATP-binding protein [Natronomonas sp.]|uniref:ABC transporter ATP-binding protein n=1 Tax=Natronomonas sp. TaxID=2184060 RepID=UPI00287061F4|nr:ABC transporter ATP-binding protein [Natronomonas sp.]MDR9380388.1 ABC transporter ATP-binding protein [Natronomonas sp.]MDR9431393.1 ABC transporter ATP-binding protein [Natronomonas sp.]